jgi:hypothetical protein
LNQGPFDVGIIRALLEEQHDLAARALPGKSALKSLSPVVEHRSAFRTAYANAVVHCAPSAMSHGLSKGE